jgi:hypothetical protein
MPGKQDKKRHVVTVMRPATSDGTLGETQGQPAVIYTNWPCSIKPLNGTESQDVRQTGASRTFEIEGYTDPKKPIKETDYLKFGERTLHIAYIDDPMQNGVQVRLVCGENL